MTGVPEVLILLPGLDIINNKTAETQGVWNWSCPGRPPGELGISCE